MLNPQDLYETLRKQSQKEEWPKSSLSYYKSLMSSQGGWGEDLSCMRSVDKKKLYQKPVKLRFIHPTMWICVVLTPNNLKVFLWDAL